MVGRSENPNPGSEGTTTSNTNPAGYQPGHLREHRRPTVQHQQRHRLTTPLVHEVQPQPVHARPELSERVQLSLPGGPIELPQPVTDQPPQQGLVGATDPPAARGHIGPACALQPLAQIREHLRRDVDGERLHRTRRSPIHHRPPRSAGLDVPVLTVHPHSLPHPTSQPDPVTVGLAADVTSAPSVITMSVPGEKTWPVGELTAASGVSVRTLRHYDEIDLLTPSARVGTGPRRYTPADVQRLQHILTLRGLGLALVDIASVIDGARLDVADLLTRQLLQVEQTLASQQRLRRVLRALLAALPKDNDDPTTFIEKIQEITTIMNRLTPEQRHELEESRRRAVAEMSKDELAELCERRRRAMDQLSAEHYSALLKKRAEVMADDE